MLPSHGYILTPYGYGGLLNSAAMAESRTIVVSAETGLTFSGDGPVQTTRVTHACNELVGWW